MLNATFSVPPEKGLSLLLLGAHCDDIEIGCGGTLLKMIEDYKIDRIMWVVFSSNEVRKKEAVTSAEQFLTSVSNVDVQVFDYTDGYLPSVWSTLKDEFEAIKERITPDFIFTHYRHDWHQDHRLINELTWNTFRNHLIFEYEIPKYDGDLGKPNFFVPLTEQYIEQKKKIIVESFQSQSDKQWFDETLLTSIMRIRGVECASASKHAEAFYNRKMVL
ncbi:N-acetylglucosaminyl deacetylase, LmbE family [Fodinibius roseus]|uniref:N-acetylglucosaminyl deacetylase, LmbE family n=1 Tax=Fodinibius roseus TaxID=1194090 RepID=A0A1M4SNN3_9BACT|nr:PIG-L deacetylase family protein [Fodinibius roseus]SHE33840.1 N-acetylglucosaminyl deacetylase, LmbE family [Fodinibius roseus]